MNPLFAQEVIIIQQKTKVAQLSDEYVLLNEQGDEIGNVKDIPVSRFGKFVRALTLNDDMRQKRFSVFNAAGVYSMGIHKPKHFSNPQIHILDAANNQLATLTKIFDFTKHSEFPIVDANNQPLAHMQAENISDSMLILTGRDGNEWARIKKQEVNFGKEVLQADRFCLRLSNNLTENQRIIALGAAIAVDVLLFPTVRFAS